MTALADDKRVRLRDSVLDRVNDFFVRKELQGLADLPVPAPSGLRAELYPYQKEGVRFAVHRKAALIGDEMGLARLCRPSPWPWRKRNCLDSARC